MPKLKIDGLEIEVEQGTKVIEAAARLGIIIPRFCYHAGLGSVGACRMCAVKFLEGPVKGVQMSCMVDAGEGMAVSTTDDEAVDFRRHVIEWLMMNHPHDCPVCDEGGHCLLQDMTVAGGHGIRRYLGKKRTFPDQYLGTFVQHEMNRCIHCWRCRRFYQEFAGYRDLGAMQMAYRTCFGRFKDGPLESPFAGNLIDLCPTGVYTDKPSRFTGRRWDFERSPSLCIHCSLGCNTVVSARYREVVKLEARFNESVNGYFICDRGRYGFFYANHPERPRRARIGREEVSMEWAIARAAETLREIQQKSGPGSIACLGSQRGSLENQAMLVRLCRRQGWENPRYFEVPGIERKVKRAVSRLDPRLAVSMREVEKADFILVVGADPLNEAPMLALAMRQAFRNEATVAVLDPRPVFLPFEFLHAPVAPGDLEPCLNALMKGAIDPSTPEKMGSEALRFYDGISTGWVPGPATKASFAEMTEKLKKSRQPVIICGTAVVREKTPELAADQAWLLHAEKGYAGLFYVMPGANAFGASLLSGEGSLFDTIERIERGSVKALLLIESDPFWSFPDRERLKKAVEKLELFLVMDYLPSKPAQLAHILFPTRTLFEMESSFINQEGRLQFAPPAHGGGIPISQISAGGHPPRLFRKDIPGGEPKPAWEIMVKLANLLRPPGAEMTPESRSELWEWMAGEFPFLTSTPYRDEPPGHIRINLDRQRAEPFSSTQPPGPEKESEQNGSLELLPVDWIFGTEELSSYSKYVGQVEKEPCLFIHPEDAAKAGIKDKDRSTVQLDTGSLEVEVRIVENMAPGVVILPCHHRSEWQRVRGLPAKLSFNRRGG